jgi:hypothetical protein
VAAVALHRAFGLSQLSRATASWLRSVLFCQERHRDVALESRSRRVAVQNLNVVSMVCRQVEREPSLLCIVSPVEGSAQAGEATPMPDQKLLSMATALRLRAEEVLTHAEAMQNADTQKKMRGVAATYERLRRS